MKKNWFQVLFFVVIGCGLLLSFSKSEENDPVEEEFIVVLDAGHGDHDPGNLGNGYVEKNIAWP